MLTVAGVCSISACPYYKEENSRDTDKGWKTNRKEYLNEFSNITWIHQCSGCLVNLLRTRNNLNCQNWPDYQFVHSVSLIYRSIHQITNVNKITLCYWCFCFMQYMYMICKSGNGVVATAGPWMNITYLYTVHTQQYMLFCISNLISYNDYTNKSINIFNQLAFY